METITEAQREVLRRLLSEGLYTEEDPVHFITVAPTHRFSDGTAVLDDDLWALRCAGYVRHVHAVSLPYWWYEVTPRGCVLLGEEPTV